MAEPEERTARRQADRALVDDCIAGSRGAQRTLFRAHRRMVHATLYRILGSNQDIEDLIQETFLQVFRSLAGFRGESQISSWIGRITTRVAFAYIRARTKQPLASDDASLVPDGRAPMEEGIDGRRALASLYAALDRLDAKYRIAYALHVIDGQPLREVAALTESSLTAVKSRVWRARRAVEKRAARDPHLAGYLTEQGVGR